MTETIDRIDQVRRASYGPRLLNGARIIGDLRRRGLFCTRGWRIDCDCNPPSDFCRAKLRWVELYCEFYGEEGARFILFGTGEYGLIEAMRVSQWHATKLTARVLVPHTKNPIRVGPNGTSWKTIFDLSALQDTADYAPALQSVLKVQGVFA